MEENEIISIATNFGLTQNQARVFITLTRYGILKVSDISKISNIGREEVYRLLPIMQKLGVVELIPDSPNRYKSISMDRLIGLWLDRKNAEYSDLNSLAKIFEKIKSDNAIIHDDFKIKVVSGRDRIRLFISELLQKNVSSLDIICSLPELLRWFSVHGEIVRHANNGIRTRIIINVSDKRQSQTALAKSQSLTELTDNTNLKIRMRTKISVCMIILGDKELVLSVDGKGPMYSSKILYTKLHSCVVLSNFYFYESWKRSKGLINPSAHVS